MAKSKDRAEQPEVVRLVLEMSPEDRRRFRAFCVAHGEDMQKLGARWILDRLAEEERQRRVK